MVTLSITSQAVCFHTSDGATCAVPAARHWAVEIKRKATIDAVEQLTRYLEFLNRDSTIAPVGGILAAQSIAPQARTLAEDRGIRCVILDYDELRGMKRDEMTLF
jgi:RecB family endonuclease NucS